MDASIELLQDDGSVRTFRALTGAWHTDPVGDVADPDALLRDAQCLDRALGSAELALDVLRRYRPDFAALTALATDPAAWLAARLPIETASQAKAMLGRLVEALGAGGKIAEPIGVPHPTLTLHHCSERLRDIEAEVERVTGAFTPRTGGRRSA